MVSANPPFSQLPNSSSGTLPLSPSSSSSSLSDLARAERPPFSLRPCSDERPPFWPVLFSLQGPDPSPAICRRLVPPKMPLSPPGRRSSPILILLKLLSLSWLLVLLRLLPSLLNSLSTWSFPIPPNSRLKRLVFQNLVCMWFFFFFLYLNLVRDYEFLQHLIWFDLILSSVKFSFRSANFDVKLWVESSWQMHSNVKRKWLT